MSNFLQRYRNTTQTTCDRARKIVEKKSSRFQQHCNIRKLIQNFVLYILTYTSNLKFWKWPKCRILEKIQKRALNWAMKNKRFPIINTTRALFNTICDRIVSYFLKMT